MRCPHCHHGEGIHSGPGFDGLSEDGQLLAPDFVAGRCHQGDCRCPGWYPDTTDLELVAATMRARERRNQLGEVPFSLTAEPARRDDVQLELF